MISHMRSILWAGWTVVVFGSVSCDGDMHHDMAGHTGHAGHEHHEELAADPGLGHLYK